MMSYNTITIATTAVLTIFFILYFLHYLTIFSRKEYRLDRILSHLSDYGLIRFVLPSRLPSPNLIYPRNLLIATLFLIILSGTVFLIYKTKHISVNYLWSILLASPITSLMSVIALSIATQPLVTVYRRVVVTLAGYRIRKYKPFVIGITGSYGKTITKDYLASIMAYKYTVLKTSANINTDIGIALEIIKKLNAKTQIFIAEIGAYRVGEIEFICKFLKPNAGIITAFGSQHSALFGGTKAIIKAKMELAHSLPRNGFLCLPDIEAKKIPKKLLGHIKAQIYHYQKSPSDSPKAQAIHASTCLASKMNMNHQTISDAIGSLSKSIFSVDEKPKKMTRFRELLLYTYSVNTNGLIHHIDLIKKSKLPKKIIFTTGIIELGREKFDEYQKIARSLISDDLITTFVTTDKILASVCESVSTKRKNSMIVKFFYREAQAHKYITSQFDQNTALLIEGRVSNSFINDLSTN
jgi:UDP-N-acetylmuramyl pentapeptide synthase